jgi:hypothetical protein
MSQPLTVALPPQFNLDEQFTVRVTALDPTTGNTVSGVNVGAVTLVVNQLTTGSLESGTFMLIPGPGA